MAYFSNGTEGEFYQEKFCCRCVHFNGCTIWMLHLIHNYDECDNESSWLHKLIPMSTYDDRGVLVQHQCNLFHEIPGDQKQ